MNVFKNMFSPIVSTCNAMIESSCDGLGIFRLAVDSGFYANAGIVHGGRTWYTVVTSKVRDRDHDA